MSTLNRPLPQSSEATTTIAGPPTPGASTDSGSRPRKRHEAPSLVSQLRTLAAAVVWGQRWESTLDADVGGVRVDLLCRNPRVRGRVALIVRFEAPPSEAAEALTAACEAANVRLAWFCGRGFIAPVTSKPNPVFRIAGTSAADAVAILPDSGLALPFVDAVAALFEKRIQFREHRLMAGPWLVELTAVRIRCWRCGAPSAAVEWAAVRADNHGGIVRALPALASALAARALEVAVFTDPRGESIEQARLTASPGASTLTNSCPACSAAFGPEMVAQVRRESTSLGTVVVALTAPLETWDEPHWCGVPEKEARRCCPRAPVLPSASWLSSCRIAPLADGSTLPAALAVS